MSARDRVLLKGFRSEIQEVSASDDFATKLLNMSHATSDYQDLSWIPQSWNHIERFFSTAKNFVGQNRFAITPEHLETQRFAYQYTLLGFKNLSVIIVKLIYNKCNKFLSPLFR